jgi:hypothetical protein
MKYTIFIEGTGYVKKNATNKKDTKFTKSMLKAKQFTKDKLVKAFLHLKGSKRGDWALEDMSIGVVACYIDDDTLDFDGVVYVFDTFTHSGTMNAIKTMLE